MILEELRRKISEIDEKIKALLDERVEIAKKIGDYKREKGLSLWDPQREQEILIWAGKYKNIFREIIGFCRVVQEPIRVCFLGPEGSYSHQAGIKLFSHYAELVPCKNFRELFDVVESKKSNFSILPIDNSLAGPVGEVLDLLLERNVYIVGEKYEKIDICLLSNKSLEDIKEVYSHPHALEQCRNYLAEKLPNANTISVDSTSKAAQLAKERDEAALGGELLSEIYSLKILDRSIQDRKNNYTRFIVISREQVEGDKTSLIFSVKNVPGALHKALGPFAKRQIDLTSIHSRPVKTKPWDYIFFMDFKGSLKDKEVKEALKELEEISTFIKILGSYPSGQVH